MTIEVEDSTTQSVMAITRIEVSQGTSIARITVDFKDLSNLLTSDQFGKIIFTLKKGH